MWEILFSSCFATKSKENKNIFSVPKKMINKYNALLSWHVYIEYNVHLHIYLHRKIVSIALSFTRQSTASAGIGDKLDPQYETKKRSTH